MTKEAGKPEVRNKPDQIRSTRTIFKPQQQEQQDLQKLQTHSELLESFVPNVRKQEFKEQIGIQNKRQVSPGASVKGIKSKNKIKITLQELIDEGIVKTKKAEQFQNE